MQHNQKNDNEIVLADFNMIGKRKVLLLVNTLCVYFRWLCKLNDKNIDQTIDVGKMLTINYDTIDAKKLKVLKDNYYYYKYIISRVEIWTTKYNHHFEHRSKEIINQKQFNDEYKKLWQNEYDPITQQIEVYNIMKNTIDEILNECQ